MSWRVVYSARARQDLRNIYEYIAYELLAHDTAVGLTQRIMREIRSLDALPMRYQLYADEPWHSQGLRYFSVDNYLVFYYPSESDNTVTILRIMYGGQDVHRQLSEN